MATAPKTTDNLIIFACILYNILREAKVLAPGQKHVDALPFRTANLIPRSAGVEWQHNFEAEY